MEQKRKRSKILLVSAVLGVICTIIVIVMAPAPVGGAILNLNLTGNKSFVFLIPLILAAISNIIAYYMNNRALAFIGAILYCMGAAIFVTYSLVIAPCIILSFIGFSNLKAINDKAIFAYKS